MAGFAAFRPTRWTHSDSRSPEIRSGGFAANMRRNDDPSRLSAMTCCFFSSLKKLLT
jgi:hypothetical protein